MKMRERRTGKKKGRKSGEIKQANGRYESGIADIPVSLSSAPGETTYMDPRTSSDFMVALESNEHNNFFIMAPNITRSHYLCSNPARESHPPN